MNNKLKKGLLIVPLLASVMAFSNGEMRKVVADSTLLYSASSDTTGNEYKNSVITSNDYLTVTGLKTCDVTEITATSFYTNLGYSFTKVLLPNGSTTDTTYAYQFETKDNDVKIKVVYGLTDSSGATTKGKLYAGGVNVYNSSGTLLTSDTPDGSSIKTFEYTISSKTTIKIGSTAQRLAVYEIYYEPQNVDSSAEDIAVSAITAIGTVEYTQTCYTAIQNAKTKIEACSDTSAISNYSTYTAAVSSFEALSTAKIETFTTAVDAIGDIDENSKSLITAAQTAYDELLASDKTNETVVAKKAVLDADLESYNSQYVTTLTTLNIGDVTTSVSGITADTRMDTSSALSIFYATKGISIESNSKTYDDVNYAKRYKTNGAMSVSSGAVQKAIRIDAPSKGIVKLITMSGSSDTRGLKVSKLVDGKLTDVYDYGNVVTSTLQELTVAIPSAGTYYIGSTNGINIYNIAFTECDTPKLEQQETSDGANIRYVATLEGVASLDDVTSWTVTLSMEGETDYTQTYTTLYTSVSGTNGKTAADNTYYLVASLKDIPSSYNGKVITCKITVTMADGTTYETNSVTYTINVTTAA